MKKLLLTLVALLALAGAAFAQTKLQPFTTKHKYVNGGKEGQVWAIVKRTDPGPFIGAYVENGNLYATNFCLHPRGGGKTLRMVFIYTDDKGKQQRLEQDIPYTVKNEQAARYNYRRDMILVLKNVRSIDKLSYYEDGEYLRVY
jgi:hypothetical protein